MTDLDDSLQWRLMELREGFDRSFAEPLAPVGADKLDLLAIRVSGEPYVLRASEISAVQADRVVTPVPSQNGELLGIIGMRGSIVAVYDLAALLGCPSGDARRWFVVAKGTPLAFAFDAFEGQVRVEQAETWKDEGVSEPLGDLVHVLGVPRRRVSIQALVLALEERARPDHGREPR